MLKSNIDLICLAYARNWIEQLQCILEPLDMQMYIDCRRHINCVTFNRFVWNWQIFISKEKYT